MKTENKLWEADNTKLRYTVEIKVFDNCCQLNVVKGSEDKITFYDLIGVLESQKLHTCFSQREKNIKQFKKKK